MRSEPHIGIYLGSILAESDFLLLRGIVNYARRAGGWYFSRDPGGNPVLSEQDLHDWRGDGLLTLIPNHPELVRLAQSGTPLVSMSFGETDASHQVVADRGLCGALGAQHLLQQGFVSFALLFETSTPSCNLDTGFLAALQRAGHAAVVGRLPPNCDTPTKGAAWSARWVSSLKKPVGILAASGSLGCDLITISRRDLGLHVPSDVAILGVAGDNLLGDSLPVGLSRVVVDLEKQGYEAARMLGQLIHGECPEHGTLRIPPHRVVLRESTDRQHLQDHEVNRALQYIRLHADRPIQVADVVNCVRVSRSTLKNRFRRERHRTIREEILRAHVERAKLLLRTTDLSISRIAADSGFTQLSRLSEAFKRETGFTPTAYRLETRAKAP